ncbi:DCN1-like protein 5 isoform X2 [Mangifera indica]|uniref:DCN1-like protein 5 isoform X2 n=1 Tax=Mangifera indica TaxID=29780 RepID=UPI001CFA6934|nr:DCN1-like protein 5 isoform X2 [Mangifera indica]
MRRSASRKTGQSNSTDSADPFLSASGKASSKEMERIDNLFYTYANRSSGVIDPEGIEALCSDLEVNHTDVRVLMLAWKMKAEKQGYFTLEEWRRGLKSLRADNVNKLKKSLPELEKEVKRPSNFMDFYAYSFRYCLTEKQKSVDIESVCELLDLVLGSQCRAQVDYFIEYLKVQTDYKVINMDQWMGFFRFCNEAYMHQSAETCPCKKNICCLYSDLEFSFARTFLGTDFLSRWKCIYDVWQCVKFSVGVNIISIGSPPSGGIFTRIWSWLEL